MPHIREHSVSVKCQKQQNTDTKTPPTSHEKEHSVSVKRQKQQNTDTKLIHISWMSVHSIVKTTKTENTDTRNHPYLISESIHYQ